MSRLSDSLPFGDFSFNVLNGSSIRAVYSSSRIVSNISFVGAFFDTFRSNVNINLVTGSVRIEQNKLVSSAVRFLVVFFSMASATLFRLTTNQKKF